MMMKRPKTIKSDFLDRHCLRNMKSPKEHEIASIKRNFLPSVLAELGAWIHPLKKRMQQRHKTHNRS